MCFEKNDLVIDTFNTEEALKKEENSSEEDSDNTSELTESVSKDMESGNEQNEGSRGALQDNVGGNLLVTVWCSLSL